VALAAAAAAFLLGSGAAEAGNVHFGIGIGFPLFGYYAPPPVYYAPPPVYYPPPPVYYSPPPAYYPPPYSRNYYSPPPAQPYAEPAPEVGANCRDYSTVVVIDGTPQTTYGRACQQPDGSWRLAY
jgi:hypothetical protein